MKALVRKSDNTVGEFLPDSAVVNLGADKVIVTNGDNTVTFPDESNLTMSVTDGLDQPEDFQPHKYKVVDGELNVVDGWVDLFFGEPEPEPEEEGE